MDEIPRQRTVAGESLALLEPTGRNARHYDVFDDLAEGVRRLCGCEDDVVVNPYHEP